MNEPQNNQSIEYLVSDLNQRLESLYNDGISPKEERDFIEQAKNSPLYKNPNPLLYSETPNGAKEYSAKELLCQTIRGTPLGMDLLEAARDLSRGKYELKYRLRPSLIGLVRIAETYAGTKEFTLEEFQLIYHNISGLLDILRQKNVSPDDVIGKCEKSKKTLEKMSSEPIDSAMINLIIFISQKFKEEQKKRENNKFI